MLMQCIFCRRSETRLGVLESREREGDGGKYDCTPMHASSRGDAANKLGIFCRESIKKTVNILVAIELNSNIVGVGCRATDEKGAMSRG